MTHKLSVALATLVIVLSYTVHCVTAGAEPPRHCVRMPWSLLGPDFSS